MKPIATLSMMLAVLLLAAGTPANAQIVITPDDLPFQPGTGPYSTLSTDNEDGTNSAAIEALVALSGANQTYDLTTLTYEFSYSGTFTVTEGATGPGAGIDPLNQATLTSLTPLVYEEEGSTVDGEIYVYERVTDDAAYNLGGYFEGTVDGEPFQFTNTNEPGGEQHYTFPLTFGSTWTSAFTQVTDLGGFELTSDVEQEYEVDGWGTMVIPDVETPIPVLRVKVTDTRTIFGIPSTSVCYELRAALPVMAQFCEGDDVGVGASASVSMIGFGGTDAESEAIPSALRLDPVYPNPTRSGTSVTFTMPTAGDVELAVFDVLGRPVQTVVRGVRAAGTHTEVVATDRLAPGMYVVRLQAGGDWMTRTFSVVR